MSETKAEKKGDKRAREETPGSGDGPSPHKKAKVETAGGKIVAATPSPSAVTLAAAAGAAVAEAAKAAAPGTFVDPNLQLAKMPGWYKHWREHAEFKFTKDNFGMRKDKPKIAIVYKGSQRPYKHATPHGPPYGDMTNEPMLTKMRNAPKGDSKYIDGTPIGLSHRLDVAANAWDTNLCTPEGEDPYAKEFCDEFLKEMAEAIADFGYDDVASQKPTPDLFEIVKVEEGDRWSAATGIPKPEYLRQECRRAMMKGRPLYIPTNKETKERLIKNRRAQLIAPVTRPQRAQEKKRVPPFLTTDPIMHKVYEHEHEYIHYPIVGAKSKAELVGPDDRKINRGDVTADYFTISVIIHKDAKPPRYSFRLNWKSSIMFRRSVFLSDEEQLKANMKDVDFSSFEIVAPKPIVPSAGAEPTKTPAGGPEPTKTPTGGSGSGSVAPTSSAIVIDTSKESAQIGVTADDYDDQE